MTLFKIVIFSLLIQEAVSITISEENRLKKKLFKNYDITIRPPRNGSVVSVELDVGLLWIEALNLFSQTLKYTFWARLIWYDEGLTWSLDDYGNVSAFWVEKNDIWRPDILVLNDARDEVPDESALRIKVEYTGRVTFFYNKIMTSSCPIDTRNFPFDQQACKIIFVSSSYTNAEVRLNPIVPGDISNYSPNGEWRLIEFNCKKRETLYPCCGEKYDELHYYIILRRRPLNILFNMSLPATLIMLLALLTFVLPSKTREKISLGISTLISLVFYLNELYTMLPRQSQHFPLLGRYLCATIFVVGFSIIKSTIVSYIYHKGDLLLRVPAIVREYAFDKLSTTLGLEEAVTNLKKKDERIRNYHLLSKTASVYDFDLTEDHENTCIGSAPKFVFSRKFRVPVESETWTKHDTLRIESAGCRSPEISWTLSEGHNPNTWRMIGIQNHLSDLEFLTKNLLEKATMFETLKFLSEEKKKMKAEWQLLSEILDRLFFIIYVICALFSILFYLFPYVDYSYDFD